MRILLWHGYLLRGSGSNVYTANIAREWRAGGHDVVVMCQERAVEGLGFVDDAFEVRSDSPSPTPAAGGTCRVARPFIADLLPVYVYDEYEGFTVKTFVDLTDEELERYTSLNVEAMQSVIDSFQPQAIITGHEVMGPYIAREACGPSGSRYVAKLHGSALEYAVKVQDRYRRYAVEGLGGAHRVAGGSEYMVREAASVVPGWAERAAVVNPGCDVDLFEPAFDRRSDPPVVAFVGKLIASKGVHHLLGALGLLSSKARVVIVGYGGFERQLRELVGALQRGDVDEVRQIATEGETGPLENLLEVIESGAMDSDYFERVAGLDIEFTGRLEHGPLSRILPTFDVLAVPSVVPEAFGMVAAEAAACGVLPIVPDHSGIAEAGAAVEAAIGAPGALTFSSSDPIRSLAATIDDVLKIPRSERDELGGAAAALARERWSWRTVAESLLSLTA